MERSEKKLAELGSLLESGNLRDIDKRIRLMRTETLFNGALRMLALYYDKSDNESIKLSISGFFNDIKNSAAKAEIIKSLAEVSRQDSMVMLASSCWQSGLDYSEHAIALADAFMAGDYRTSLECFTVIDNCSGSISDGDRLAIIFKLKNEINTYDTFKQKLAGELITLLKK
ncbi:MAG: hypothetical protein RBT02_05965 [Bacteroidales bacterium]|jgi:hypothetical protein|nr:hypothetical protein [Bacteroidales bacterium]